MVSDELYSAFTRFVKEEKLWQINDRLLIAVSGGLDSVVLTHLIARTGVSFEFAHANFQLRASESMRDEAFVRQLADQYQVVCHVKRFDTESFAGRQKLSIQEAARELRYQWFDELLKVHKLKGVLTAHHADDNAETMLMNLFKGTGMAGLKGILPRSVNRIRPLLFASRKQIKDYAEQHALAFVEDSSNLSVKYTRNFIRHELIPLLAGRFPGVEANLRENMPRFRESWEIYQEAVARKIKGLIHQEGKMIRVPVEKLRLSKSLHTIVLACFAPYGFSSGQIEEIINLMDSETGKYLVSPTHRLLKNRNWLIVSPLREEEQDVHVVEELPAELFLNGHPVSFVFADIRNDFSVSTDPDVMQLDARHVHFPLIVRKWKAGDYFYPLGMNKKKKIARFLIDSKLSKFEKENVWVAESANRIICVIGHRIDHRFRIINSTRQIFVLKLDKH